MIFNLARLCVYTELEVVSLYCDSLIIPQYDEICIRFYRMLATGRSRRYRMSNAALMVIIGRKTIFKLSKGQLTS
jgi:hypothetical protein